VSSFIVIYALNDLLNEISLDRASILLTLIDLVIHLHYG
jgi:uncharacterized membrane protein